METSQLTLRSLDPVADLPLFREAHAWRKPKRVSAEQISLDQFTKPDPTQAVMGLFNGEFLAAYMVKEYASACYDMHFTSKPEAPREYLVAGGIKITSWLIEHGAIEVSAVIISRNRALKRFLEDCGYTFEKQLTFNNSPHAWLRYVA